MCGQRVAYELRFEVLHPFRQAARRVVYRGCFQRGAVQHTQDHALSEVCEFSHIAWPIVRHDILLDRRGHLRDVAVKAARCVAEVMCEEQRDVVPTFAQGRNADRDDIQPIEHVFAEF
ncbi:hypothetical protein G6F57_023249 [Rhizopus arrhizus]|nr:hypothetical protein G6F57_023249 [Rhizopus arrhizus]